jgi:hypothetical protein
MKDYLILHCGFKMPTAEEMGAWHAWFDTIAERQVDRGGFRGGKSLSGDGTEEMPFGPDSITGYTIFRAENMDEAERIAKECPIVSSTQVYEIHR